MRFGGHQRSGREQCSTELNVLRNMDYHSFSYSHGNSYLLQPGILYAVVEVFGCAANSRRSTLGCVWIMQYHSLVGI